MTSKASNGLVFEEPSIFEIGEEGQKPSLFSSDVSKANQAEYKNLLRNDLNIPNLSESEVVRHFTRLSILNYHKDLGLYPLGSCTMKHNPKIADKVASFENFSEVHPLQPSDTVQGSLRLAYELEKWLCEISGMSAATLWPAAGSHGELTGMLMIKKYHESKGNQKKYVLVPDSAHGTNPASAAVCGYEVKEIKSTSEGILDAKSVAEAMTEDVAAIMITNPNTLGVFEKNFKEIADLVHSKGGLVYMDGANLNALMGYVKPGEIGVDVLHFNLHKTFATPHGGGGPGSGPVGVVKQLEEFLPKPRIVKKSDKFDWDLDCPKSIGRIKLFWGNFAILVRAYTYLKAIGGEGLKEVTENAVLNANYIRNRLINSFDLPYSLASLHECVFSDKKQQQNQIKTMDIAKRLMDYGFHPPTVYFPLIVSGAIMIEPTETESKQVLDEFCDAMIKIAKECEENPEIVKSAPHISFRSRIDEARAAREVKVCY